MKRRLNRAYDHMTMPDRCSESIEQALRQELKKKELVPPMERAVYTRMVAPEGKRKNVWVSAVAAVLAVLLLSIGGVGLVLRLPADLLPDTAATTPTVTEFVPEPTQETEPVPPVSTATILSTGDLMMNGPVIKAGLTEDGYQFDSIFRYAAGSIMAADYAVANLETTLASDETYPYGGSPNFNCPDDIVSAVNGACFDLLLNANNHSYDTGSAGMHRTIEVIREWGLDSLGIVESQEEKRYLVKEINGIKIGMVCYTYETDNRAGSVALNGLLVNPGDQALMNTFDYGHLEDFYEDLRAQLEQMRSDGAEAVIAYLHWGTEYQMEPSEQQSRIAQKLCDLGIDAIIGSHPHVVQPLELLESTADPGHKTVVLYSMGNAVSNQRQGNVVGLNTAHTEDGVLFSVTFARYADGSVGLDGVELVPTWVYCRETNTGREYNILPLYKDRSALWTDEFEFSDVSAAAARNSYDRTMEIVGAGLEKCEAWLKERRKQQTGTGATPADFYAAATKFSAEEVETAALEIRQAVLQENWHDLHNYLYDGYQLGDLPLENADKFADFMALYGIREEFRNAIEAETCRRMFCNYDDGIMMGDAGQIWLAEIGGKLKIAAINDMIPQTTAGEDAKAHEQLAEILGGSGTFQSDIGQTTIRNYFEQMTAEGIPGDATHCAVMDLDGNGTREVLLRIAVGENNDVGTLVLYADEGGISGQMLYYREIYLLKADGTFSWSGGASDSGIGRLEISGGQLVTRRIHWSMPQSDTAATDFRMTYWKNGGQEATEAEFDALLKQQEAKADAQWMAYPEEVRTAAAEVQAGTNADDQDAIRALMYRFGDAYFDGDTDDMAQLLADGVAGLQPGGLKKQSGVVMVDCKGIPKGKILDAGCNVSLEVLEEGQDSYSYLSMSLVKKAGGWYVKDYGLEK